MDVLVCIKRVPGASGRLTLTDDAMSVDARHVGYTLSPHEECAVEMAVRLIEAHGGAAGVLTVGTPESLEQVREALSVGLGSAVLVEADSSGWGPADVAAAIAEVVREHASRGISHDVLLLGNEAADTADFQVGVRLAEELSLPCVTAVKTIEVADGILTARRDGPDGTEVYEVPLPAVVTVREGSVIARYPSVPGRIRAKKAPVEHVSPTVVPQGNGRTRLTLPPEAPSTVEVLGSGSDAAPAVVDLLERLGLVQSGTQS